MIKFVKWLFGLDAWTFYIPLDSGWTGARTEALLKKHGIKISRRNVVGGDAIFNVKLSEASEAKRVMKKVRVPFQ